MTDDPREDEQPGADPNPDDQAHPPDVRVLGPQPVELAGRPRRRRLHPQLAGLQPDGLVAAAEAGGHGVAPS
jgi:hypothetical protein